MRTLTTLAVLAIVLGGPAAYAQEPPRSETEPDAQVGEPQETPSGSTEIVVPGVAVPDAPASLWTVGLRAEGAWDSNVRLVAGEESSFSERLRATLTHAKRSPRGTFALSTDASGAMYQGNTGLDSVDFAGAASGTYALGPRATLRSGAAASSTYSAHSVLLNSEGLVLPLSRVNTLSGTAGVARRLGARTSLSTDVRYDRVAFDGVEASPSSAFLSDGSVLVAGASLSPQIGLHDNLDVSYQFQRSDTSGAAADSHSVTLGWARVLGRRFRANAAAGATRYELATRPDPGWALRSTAALAARFRRSSLVARYDRGIDQAYGLGRDRLSDVLSAGFSVTARRNVVVSATGVYGVSRDPAGDPLRRFDSQSAAAALSWSLSRRVALSTGYTYRRTSPSSGAPVTGQAVVMSLGYAREWRP